MENSTPRRFDVEADFENVDLGYYWENEQEVEPDPCDDEDDDNNTDSVFSPGPRCRAYAERHRLNPGVLVSTFQLREDQDGLDFPYLDSQGNEIGVHRIAERGDTWSMSEKHRVYGSSLAANHKPAVRGGDQAFWNRFWVVPFEHTIPPEHRLDANVVEARLQAELPGILAWAVRGWLDCQASGLNTPALVRDAVAEYRGESDVVGQFLDECCHTDADRQAGRLRLIGEDGQNYELVVSYADLFKAWKEWAEEAGLDARDAVAFRGKLAGKGYRASAYHPPRTRPTGRASRCEPAPRVTTCVAASACLGGRRRTTRRPDAPSGYKQLRLTANRRMRHHSMLRH